MNLECKILAFGSKEQQESIGLRREILRLPLKLDFTEEELACENEQIHIGCYFEMVLVGILLLVPKANGFLKMRQVAVSQSIQGKGVGKQMVKYSEEWALKNGFTKLDLHARETAMSFYLSMKYNVIGDKFIELGLPHFMLEKALKQNN